MAGLDLDSIAAAALAVADDKGADGLTIRAVADVLGVTPMALYHHVENKKALVALLVEFANREHPLPEPTGRGWKEDLLELAHWSRENTEAHPAIGQLQMRYKAWTPSVLTLGEYWLNIWRQSGLDFDLAMQGALASSLVIVGVTREMMVLKEFEPPDERVLSWLPTMRALFRAESVPSVSYDLVISSFIDGLHDALQRESQARAALRAGNGEVVKMQRRSADDAGTTPSRPAAKRKRRG